VASAQEADWVRATVVTDGGSVYSQPDFDAKVVDYLAFKTSLHIQRKAVLGQGGLGLFHRVRYNNKIGFMADTDIRVVENEPEANSTPPAGSADKTTKQNKKNRSKAFEEEEMKRKEPLYFSRQIGAALASVNFTEKFSGRKLSSQTLMYGLRLTGPGALFDGPPLDFNLWFSLQKPGYYKDFAQEAKGFLLFGDIMAMLPLIEWKNGLINYGLGLMWTYTNYKVTIKNKNEAGRFDSQEFRVGADFDLGVAFRIKPVVLRADAKYYFEKTQYLGFVGSFQVEY
jgi:hypothetical protein